MLIWPEHEAWTYADPLAAKLGFCDDIEAFLQDVQDATNELYEDGAYLVSSPFVRALRAAQRARGREWDPSVTEWLEAERKHPSESVQGLPEFSTIEEVRESCASSSEYLEKSRQSIKDAQLRSEDLLHQCAPALMRYWDAYHAYQALSDKGIIRRWRGLRKISLRRHDAIGIRHEYDGLGWEDFYVQPLIPEAEQWFKVLKERIRSIHDSNGTAYYEEEPLRVGVLASRFSLESYRDFCEFIPLTKGNYQTLLDSGDLDAILYVTSWKTAVFADDGECIDSFELWLPEGFPDADAINEMLAYAKSQDPSLPIVFESVEDPPNYQIFMPIARNADFIFTTAEEKIDSYISDTGISGAEVATYGINPTIHNPIGFLGCRHGEDCDDGSIGVMFAGSWYKKYPKRCEDARTVFDGVVSCPGSRFVCLDRNFALSSEYWAYPEEYAPYVFPSVSYADSQKATKLFDWCINLNSVTESKTMYARRVNDVQALGCLLLSNFAYSIAHGVPGVFTIFESEEVPRILTGYTQGERINMQLEGIRDTFNNNTSWDILARMLGKALPNCTVQKKSVYVVCDLEDPSMREDLAAQSLTGIQIVDRADAAESLKGESGFAILWDDQPHNKDYLMDMVNAFKFVDVRYVAYVDPDDVAIAYDYLESAKAPKGALFDLDEVAVEDILAGEVSGEDGFAVIAPIWDRVVSDELRQLAVLIPIMSELEEIHLQKRSFRSLLRSSAFDAMHVYLVCDSRYSGQGICEELEQAYPNVSIIRASEPSISEAMVALVSRIGEGYVTVLSPLNEGVGDGYEKMLDALRETHAQYARGGVIRVTPKGPEWVVGSDCEDPTGDNAMELLQGAVFERRMVLDWLTQNPSENSEEDNLALVEGSVLVDYRPLHS